MKIETYGHTLPKHVGEWMLGALERRRKNAATHEDFAVLNRFPVDWSGECKHCGRRVTVTLSEDAQSAAVTCQTGWDPDLVHHAPDAECPMPTIEPVAMRFTSRSGRVALGNDFRQHFDWCEQSHRFDINNHAGSVAYMRWFEDHGYLTGYVGNTCVWFVPRDGALDVVFPGGRENHVTDDEWDQLDRTCAHRVSTELWWFAILDADDLPEGATDSYDREFAVFELPRGPGEYEMTYYPPEAEAPDGKTVAIFRPVP